MANDLISKDIKFLVPKKDYSKIEKQNNICINVFCYENDLVYPVLMSRQRFEDYMDLLLINEENKSHYVYIKNFNRFMFNKKKCKNRKHFSRYCLQCFCSEKVWMEHREICLEINDKQSVKLESGATKFKNYFKQIAAPFKTYADFESLLKGLQIKDRDKNTSYTEKYQDHILWLDPNIQNS